MKDNPAVNNDDVDEKDDFVEEDGDTVVVPLPRQVSDDMLSLGKLTEKQILERTKELDTMVNVDSMDYRARKTLAQALACFMDAGDPSSPSKDHIVETENAQKRKYFRRVCGYLQLGDKDI